MTTHSYDPALAAEVIRFGVFAADMEILNCKPTPVSAIRNPDGSTQPETGAERTRRVVSAAITHLLDVGLITIPDAAPRLIEAGIPLDARG